MYAETLKTSLNEGNTIMLFLMYLNIYLCICKKKFPLIDVVIFVI